MKIRNGFVSNSSSSSFIIVVKKGKLTADKLMEIFKTDKDSPLYGLVKGIAKTLVNNSREISVKELISEDSYYGQYLGEDKIREFIQNNYVVYAGSVSTEDGGLECALCENVGFNYEDDEFILKKEEGY